MKFESKRIFINNLPPNITQTDLEQKFAEYGIISSVEIKQRKNYGTNQTSQFAFITLMIDKSDLTNCLDEFANKKWKGNWMHLQEAKESFMVRLKRERQEKDEPKVAVSTSFLKLECPVYNVASSTSTKVYHSSSSEDDSVPSGQEPKIPNYTIKQNLVNGYKDRNNQDYFNDIYEISGSSNRYNGQELTFGIEKSEQVSESDRKRKQSIIQMRKNYQQQKQHLKNSLSSIDAKPNNKIIFDDAEIDISPVKKLKTNKESCSQLNKTALFEDDGLDNEEYNFEIREQFEGRSGQKLMQLQSRFKNDKRFAMDKRFLEDEQVNTADEQSNNDNEVTMVEEREKQFEILEQVLGEKARHKSTEKYEKNDRQNLKMMVRFDPSQPDHSKFEIKENEKKRYKAVEKKIGAKIIEEVPKPEVSKETFYKVAVNLKDALHEKAEFSLAHLFSKAIEAVEPEKEDNTASNITAIKTTNTANTACQLDSNPFRYDSSADEDDTQDNNNRNKPVPVHIHRVSPAMLWTESFFFKHDDYRLQEGLDFIKRLEVDDQPDFPKLRRNLHEIAKAKVKNNQRKNRPFRQKLGGKKRLRVKRALKR